MLAFVVLLIFLLLLASELHPGVFTVSISSI
jgi:hypothetical protein